ncbi:MAG: mechanosensitive ion channel family protein [Clostridiales bacterium]|nr:mechanosensitive ion channel family protein [Clostridiales bacterium]
MRNPNVSPGSFYLELLVFFFAAGVALFLSLLARRAFGRLKKTGAEAMTNFLRRVSFPAFFLIVSLALKFRLLETIFALSQRFYAYVDAAIIFFVALFLITLADAWLLYRYQKKRLAFPLPRVLHGFILFVLYVIVFFIVLRGILGINITPLLATSAIFTAIIGLAFQGVLSNVLAGISLNLTRSFSRGDWVKIGPHEGVVMEMNWRETLILDRLSNVVVIPNNTVASEMIINFSHPDRTTALTLPLKVSYSAAPATVLEALRQAAREVPDVLATPAPQAYILSYDEAGISYLLKYWVTDFSRKHTITGDVARHIWYKFRRLNVEIPVALAERVRDIVQTVKLEEKVAAQEEETERTFADLLHSSLLRYPEGEKAGELIVSEEDVRQLARLARGKRYTRGEVLFHQGEKGESCYIVARGTVKGEIVYEEKGKRYASEFRVGPGGIFGEMSLFTGLPRTATGTVEEDAELLEIGADGFAFLLSRNPGLAEVIAELVSERNTKNQDFLRKIKELSEKDVEESCDRKSILDRLKRLILRFKRPSLT